MQGSFAVMSLALAGCVGSGWLQASVSGQIVGVDYQPLGPGLLLAEVGPVHEGSYQFGAPVGKDGRFALELPGGGTYGLHLFVDGYQYLPLEIEIQDHQQVGLTSSMVAWQVWMDLTGQPTWPAQPDDDRLIRMPLDDTTADNPVIDGVTMTYPTADTMEVEVTVHDPEADLSRMILAYDPTTGAGYALNPPAAPDSGGNYPDGTYAMTVFLDPDHEPGRSTWQFVVSDNMCNDTDILEVTMPEM